MSLAISGITSTQTADTPASPKAKFEKASSGGDTVQISVAALAAAKTAAQSATKEASETPAQTAKEAQAGDHQAQQLLAKEAAAKVQQ